MKMTDKDRQRHEKGKEFAVNIQSKFYSMSMSPKHKLQIIKLIQGKVANNFN